MINSTLNVQIRRECILTDSFRALYKKNMSSSKILNHFRISYKGENGVDAGGLRTDWFTSLVKELFNPMYGLFISSPNGRTYYPNPNSSINEQHINYFDFAGQILARALIEAKYVEANLSLAFYKQLLGYKLSISDLDDMDPLLAKSLKWIQENSVDSLDIDFTTELESFGDIKMFELIENGKSTKVTDENKNIFIKKKINFILKKQIKEQIKAFKKGFYSLISQKEIRIFTPSELSLMICGISTIDVNDFKNNCDFQHPYSLFHPTIIIFFNVIFKFTNENLAKLLMFITGSSQVPIGGFKKFKENGYPIIITPVSDKTRLPQAHTCMNTLDLPQYQNEEELRNKLLLSINECNAFGML